MTELKPCPFCGGEACMQIHKFVGYTSTYGVVCLDCCVETRQFYRTEKEAAEAWNRRCDADYCGECRIDYPDKDAKSVLEALPSAQQWTPCSERPPEQYGVYIVTDEYDNVFEYDYSDKTMHNGKWSFCGNEIVAWMPLPEPYKAESEE